MQKIFIKGLEVNTFVGVYAWEQEAPRLLRIDLEIPYDFRRAGETDNLNDTLDYDALSTALVKHLESQRFQLIERVAFVCVNFLKEHFQMAHGRIKIIKPKAIEKAEHVGVEMEW